MDKVLITGSAGLIGANLANKFLTSYDTRVVGIDNFCTSNISNIYPLLKHKRFNFIESDFLSADLPICDIVFHCIDRKNDDIFKTDKYQYIDFQLKYLNKILEYSKINNAKLVILTEFADFFEFENKESTYNNYLNLYKDLVVEYQKTNKTDIKIARIPKVYGFNFSKDYLQTIEKIILNAISNNDVVIKNNIADYYISADMLSIILINLAKSNNDKIITDIITDKPTELKDIADFIINYTNSKSNLIINNPEPIYPKYKPDSSYMNTTGIDNEFFDHKKCLPKIIEYFKIAYFS